MAEGLSARLSAGPAPNTRSALRCAPAHPAPPPRSYGKAFDRTAVCHDPEKSLLVRVVDSCPCHYPSNYYSNKRWCCGGGWSWGARGGWGRAAARALACVPPCPCPRILLITAHHPHPTTPPDADHMDMRSVLGGAGGCWVSQPNHVPAAPAGWGAQSSERSPLPACTHRTAPGTAFGLLRS